MGGAPCAPTARSTATAALRRRCAAAIAAKSTITTASSAAVAGLLLLLELPRELLEVGEQGASAARHAPCCQQSQ